jgi:hypothetical protein
MSGAWKVFYSYAHEDSAVRNELAEFLAPLKHSGRIVEWHDRQIKPGVRWETEIFSNLDSADLIVLLVSKSFLGSNYCFGIEMERAMQRFKTGAAVGVPVLIGPCLWKESRFSELQCLPRNGKPVSSWPSRDEALADIATEISEIVKAVTPAKGAPPADTGSADLQIVRDQIVAYARLYERVRQQMEPSPARTVEMENVFSRMQSLVLAAFPLLPELVASPSPGEKLAGIAILQTFANAGYLPFLVNAVGSEKPFVGYHAVRALQFAVSALEPRFYPVLETALNEASAALNRAEVGFDTDRQALLRRAHDSLRMAMTSFAPPAVP